MKPLVSVNIATYNHKQFIGQCIESVLMQKVNFSFEVIIHDDASTDGTSDILRQYSQKYDNVVAIIQNKNLFSQGENPSVEHGISSAKGKYIALCDGDDYWTDPLKLQKQVDLIENEVDVGLVYTNFAYLIGSEKSEHNFEFTDFSSLDDFFVNNIPFLFTGSWLINRKYIEQLQFIVKYPNLPGDAQIAAEILSRGGKIVRLNKQTGVYRLLAESASHSKEVNKDIGFLQLKYSLMKKYKKELNFETRKNFVENLIRKQFHNFSYLELNFFERLELLQVILKLKGFSRTFKFLLFNKT